MPCLAAYAEPPRQEVLPLHNTSPTSLQLVLLLRERSIASQGEVLLGLPPKLARGFFDY